MLWSVELLLVGPAGPGVSTAVLHFLVLLLLQPEQEEGAEDGDDEDDEEDQDDNDAHIDRVAADTAGQEAGQTLVKDLSGEADIVEKSAAALERLNLIVDGEVDKAAVETCKINEMRDKN